MLIGAARWQRSVRLIRHRNQHSANRSACCLIAAVLAFSPASVLAQSDFYFVPWLTVEEVYDDNIFFDTEDEVSDFITRVSPRLDVGYDSETLDWLLSYRNDAEWYNDFSELDSTKARRFAEGEIEVRPSRRWTWSGQARFTNTNTAEDLSLTPGGVIPGQVGRVEAERLLIGAGAEHRISQRFTGSLDVTWINDELVDFSENETFIADAQVEQVLNSTRSLLYGYLYRDYDFSVDPDSDPGVPLGSPADSNTAYVGLVQALSETSDLELRVGPRVSEGDVEPYLVFRWEREYDRGTTVIEALWDETTLLGEFERLDSQTISASWSHTFSANFDVRGSAGYAYLSGPDYTTDIASFEIAGDYRFSEFILLTAWYSVNAQQENAEGFPSGGITHNVVSLSLTFTRPRGVTDRSSS